MDEIRNANTNNIAGITSEKLIDDNFSQSSDNFNDFICAVSEIEKNTSWIKTKTSGLNVCSLPEKKESSTSDSIYLNLNTDEDVKIRKIALPSLYARAKISGAALSKISKADLAYILTCCLKTVPEDEEAQAVIVGNKISAVHSERYVRMDSTAIFQMADKTIKSLFPNAAFVAGGLNHEKSRAKYEINDTRLINAYHDSISIADRAIKPEVYVNTSNVGLSGADIYPCFRNGNVSFIIGNPLCVKHNGNASLEKFQENANMLYSLFQKCIKNFIRMKSIQIHYPANCFLNVAKRIGIPKKLAIKAFDDFKALVCSPFSNAHDVYIGLTQTLAYAKADGKTSGEISTLRENIARALTINWTDYDLPTIGWQYIDLSAA